MSLSLRVRFAETDQMGVAHHSAYVVWLEAARIEWLRERGLDYRKLEAAGVSLAVSSVSVQYGRSTHFDDLLTIEATMTELKSRRVRFRYVVRCEGVTVATGESLHTPVNGSGHTVRLPTAWLENLQEHVIKL